MNETEWTLEVAPLLIRWWPESTLTSAASAAYRRTLEGEPAKETASAIRELADEGAVRRPPPGQIRNRIRLIVSQNTPPQVRTVCTCGTESTESCPAKHSKGWRERQAQRDQAIDIVDRAEAAGIEVKPHDYDGYLGDAVACVLLRRWYDANREAGRAIHDPGDEHGCPTIGKGAGCRLAPTPSNRELQISVILAAVDQGNTPDLAGIPEDVVEEARNRWKARRATSAT